MNYLKNAQQFEREAPPREWFYYAKARTLQELKKDKVKMRPGTPYKSLDKLASAMVGQLWWHSMKDSTRKKIMRWVKEQRVAGKTGVVTSKGRKKRSEVVKKLGKKKAEQVYKKIGKLKRGEKKEAKEWLAKKPKTPKKKSKKTAANPLTEHEIQEALGRARFSLDAVEELMESEGAIRAAAALGQGSGMLDAAAEFGLETPLIDYSDKIDEYRRSIDSRLDDIERETEPAYAYNPLYDNVMCESMPFVPNPELLIMLNPPSKKSKKKKTRKAKKRSKKTSKKKKTTKRKKNPSVTEISLEELKKKYPAQYKKAVKKYKQFHQGALPTSVKVVNLPDSAPLRKNSVLVALGNSLEAVYHVPKHSKKQSKIPFKHDFENPVMKVTDPEGDLLMDISVGKKGYKVTDWIRH